MSTHLDPSPSTQQESSAVSKDCDNFKMSSDLQKRYPSSVSEVPFSARAPMTEVPASSKENALRINDLIVFWFSLSFLLCQSPLPALSKSYPRTLCCVFTVWLPWVTLPGKSQGAAEEHGFEGLQKVPPSLLTQGLSWINFCQINASVDLRHKQTALKTFQLESKVD